MGAFSNGFEKSAGYVQNALREIHGQLMPWRGTSGAASALGYASYIPDTIMAAKEINKYNDAEDVAAVKVRKLKQETGNLTTKEDRKQIRAFLASKIKDEAKEGGSGLAGSIGLGAVGAGLLAAPFTGGASLAAMLVGGAAGGIAGDKLGRKAYRTIVDQ